MPRIIAEPCVGVKDAACVEVCPVDCIHPMPNDPRFHEATQLYIDPNECIDCAVCVPECPVEAIYAEEDVPGDQQDFIALNAELSREWKPITRTKESLPEAEEWRSVADKRSELQR